MGLSDIQIGDVLYDVEAEGILIGIVSGFHRIPAYYYVDWNDGSQIEMYAGNVRALKKEWHKLKRKCLTRKRK